MALVKDREGPGRMGERKEADSAARLHWRRATVSIDLLPPLSTAVDNRANDI